MSGTAASLFSGAPVPGQPTGSDTSTSFPLWQQQFGYNLANAATNIAGQPYSPYPGQQVVSPSSATQQGWNLALNNVGNYQPALNSATSLTAAGATPVSSSQIGSYTDPYATPITGANITPYLNPYTSNVIGGLQQAANTNLIQNQLPAIQSQFVSAGQAASPQQMQANNNALYQSNQALDQATSQALQSGYSGALGTALQEQQGQEQSYSGALSAAMQEQAAKQVGGAQMGQLGALTQELGAGDVSQVAATGQAQDTVGQSNINAAMNNFYAQQQWPYQNLSYASNIIRGQAVPSNTMQVGLSSPSASSYAASPLATGLGATIGGSAIGNALGLKRGGAVRRPNSAARSLERRGRGGDTILAHINPSEAALLKAHGGSGTRNPRTGLLEFEGGGGDNYVGMPQPTYGPGSPSGLYAWGSYAGPSNLQQGSGDQLAPGALTATAPSDFKPLAAGATAPSYVAGDMGALGSLASRYQMTPDQGTLGSFTMNGQSNYGWTLPNGLFAPAMMPTQGEIPSAGGVPQDALYPTPLAGATLQNAPNLPGAWSDTNNVLTPTQEANREAAVNLPGDARAYADTGPDPLAMLGLLGPAIAAGPVIGGIVGGLSAGAAGAAAAVPGTDAFATSVGLGGTAGADTAPTSGLLSNVLSSPVTQGLKAASNLNSIASAVKQEEAAGGKKDGGAIRRRSPLSYLRAAA